jgi:hypothetical protein
MSKCLLNLKKNIPLAKKYKTHLKLFCIHSESLREINPRLDSVKVGTIQYQFGWGISKMVGSKKQDF